MAKKSRYNKKRKQRKTNVPVYTVPVEGQADEAAVQTNVKQAQSPFSNPLASGTATTDSIDWAKEYPYFAPDMKLFGIVVTLMVILLLALNVIFIYLL